jgi:lysine biosynthesis protein LysW
MVYKATCPECGRRHRFKGKPRIHEQLVCKKCQASLAVVQLAPVELELTAELAARSRRVDARR